MVESSSLHTIGGIQPSAHFARQRFPVAHLADDRHVGRHVEERRHQTAPVDGRTIAARRAHLHPGDVRAGDSRLDRHARRRHGASQIGQSVRPLCS
jgi:hypothetical protein